MSVERWRADTPGCRERNHLNNAGAALMPAPVLEAVHGHLDLEARRGGYEAEDLARGTLADAYEAVAALIGAGARNVAVVENATVAVAQALSAFPFVRGDVVVTTDADYGSNRLMLLSLARRFGIRIERAAERPEGGADPESVRAILARGGVRLVTTTWVPTNSGLVQDAAAIGAACADHGVPFLLDACQAVGQFPVDVAALRCDFLAATARKFLRGPRGIGFLYVSDGALARGLEPLFLDIQGATWTAPDQYEPAADARRFENWEFAYALVLGMGAAARYAAEVGVAEGGRRAARLAALARERLAALPGARVLDRGRSPCAIVSVAFEGRDARDLVRALREGGINCSASVREHSMLDMDRKGVATTLRVSPHYYNTEDEIAALAAAMRPLLA